MELIKWLKAPDPVVKFQKFCGIEYRIAKQPAGYDPSGDNIRNTGEDSGQSATKDSLNSRKVNSQRKNVQRSTQKENDSKLSEDLEPPFLTSDGNVAKENEYTIKYKFLHYLFLFGASLGDEIFYIVFFPYWFWNIDGYVGRRMCIFWCISMYLGQSAKDVIRWPRPPSPPVVRLEKRYALEYGMPSTHAIVGAGVPFSILYFSINRYEFPLWCGLGICLIWTSLVCFSRLYLGMHSILDIMVGLVFTFFLMPVIFPFVDTIDTFTLNNKFAPVVCVVVCLLMGYYYPALEKWSTARGDTAGILGLTAGQMIGHWIAVQTGFMRKSITALPYQILMPSWTLFGLTLMRYFLGALVLVLTRGFMKWLCLRIAVLVFGIDKSDIKAQKLLVVELPSTFFTYTVVAINVVYTAPYFFDLVGIERTSCFTEL